MNTDDLKHILATEVFSNMGRDATRTAEIHLMNTACEYVKSNGESTESLTNMMIIRDAIVRHEDKLRFDVPGQVDLGRAS